MEDIQPYVPPAPPRPEPQRDPGPLFTFNVANEQWSLTRPIYINNIYYLYEMVIFENPIRPYNNSRHRNYLGQLRNTEENERMVSQFIRELLIAPETNFEPGEDQIINSFPARARTCAFGRAIRMNGYMNCGASLIWDEDRSGFTLFIGHQIRTFNFEGAAEPVRPRQNRYSLRRRHRDQ